MKKENRFTIFIFIFIIIILVAFSKLFGEANRWSNGPIESLTWSEVQSHALKYIFISALLTIISRYFYIEAEKQKEKDIDKARKRIADREKEEKKKMNSSIPEESNEHEDKLS